MKWKAGESGNKFISVKINDDNEQENQENFTINLSNISCGSFGPFTSITVIINDDDPCEKKDYNNIIRSQNSGLWNQTKTWQQARVPSAGDIVIVEHSITAPAEPIKLDKGELCIQKQGELISQARLEIHAAVIHNFGTIRGADGKNGVAKSIEKCNFFQHATAGSRIEIWTDKLINEATGKIIAGKGGDDLTYLYLSNSIGKCDGTSLADLHESKKVHLAQLSVTNTRAFPFTGVAGAKVPVELRLFNNGVQPYDSEPAAPKPASSCQLFYVKQNKQQQSQFFTITVPEFKLRKLSKLNKDFDIQDIAIDPKTHFIYASSGKKEHLYKADSLTGKLFSIGDIGFDQVDSLTFHANGTLYGWAQGHGT